MILLSGLITLLVGFTVGFLYARHLYKDNQPENKKQKPLLKNFKITFMVYKWRRTTVVFAPTKAEAIEKFKKEEFFHDQIIGIEEI